MLIAGADGCPKGWAVATATVVGEALADLRVELVETLDTTVANVRDGTLSALAIDMPIGLINEHPRTADVQARKVLGARRSSVFPTPILATLEAADYDDARVRSLDACGKALSKQAWNLMPKIRDLDALVTADDQPAIAEAHPECAFLRLQADIPLDHAKSTDEGRALRIRLLRASGRFNADELDLALASKAAPVVDLLDAIALTVTARHMAT
ncbi:MAG: DUF429 domain-containing protein, partial [Ilumatobacter sp.]